MVSFLSISAYYSTLKIDLDAVEQAKRPLELFYSGCKSKETKQQYATLLKKIVNEFFEDILDSKGFEERVNEFVYKAQNDPKWATEIIIAMVKMLKARTELPEKDSNYLRPISFKNYFPPLRKLLDLNEVTIPWAKVTSQYPVMKDLDDSRGYTRDEIKKVLEHADAIDKAIVTIAASSGIRAGAFDFKWRHIRPVYLYNDHLLWEDDKLTESVVRDGKIACAMILIYEGEIESQFAFVTLECYNFIQNYKTEWIQKVGKEPKPDDPFLRSESIIVKPLSKRGVRSRVERLLEKAGLRQPLIKGKRRHEIPIMNGFRRFFNKANKESISKDSLLASLIKKEMMMGHVGLIKLDKNYFKAHVNELLEEYLNAVPNLTIDDSEKLKLQNRAKDEKINQLELEKDAKIAQLERDMAYVKKLLIQTKKDNSSS